VPVTLLVAGKVKVTVSEKVPPARLVSDISRNGLLPFNRPKSLAAWAVKLAQAMAAAINILSFMCRSLCDEWMSLVFIMLGTRQGTPPP
jgi:hypothetical protein